MNEACNSQDLKSTAADSIYICFIHHSSFIIAAHLPLNILDALLTLTPMPNASITIRFYLAGVKLERGFVADEDTTIYNPGLSLLTESEKDKIVNAVIQNRKENKAKKTWSTDNEFAFDFLKTKLDPLHMAELKGYLGVLPIYGAAVYVVALGVQQFARDLFAPAYVISAVAIFLPALALILKGV